MGRGEGGGVGGVRLYNSSSGTSRYEGGRE